VGIVVSITRVPHSVNGKKYGMFYHFDDGRCLYLAWRSGEKSRSLFFRKNAWCLDIATLREAERRGATAIGVAHRVGKNVHYYITRLQDFWSPPSEPHPEGTTPQRRLGRDKFLVNTSISSGSIAKAMKLR
jgi:hypothetical protein